MKINCLLVGLALSGSVYAEKVHEPLKIHILKEGETLSELLYAEDFKPLYGKKNWVEQTLQINNLTLERAKQIKTGYPVILPAHEIEEVVVVKEAAISHTTRKGLFGGKVSDKINLNIEFGYFYQSAQTKNASIDVQENYHLALNIEGRERYEVANKLWSRPLFSLSYESQNTLAFNDNANVDANFVPTYEIEVGALSDYKNLPFSVLSKLNIHERSRLYEKSNQDVDVRRDRRAEIILGLSKVWERKHMVYTVAPYVGQSIWSQSTDGLQNDSVFTTGLEGKINLTEDSNLKAYLQGNTYNSNESTTIMGINWDYQIK